MPVDLAGDTWDKARNLNVNSSLQTFTDYVGASDLNDYYSFTLSSSSSSLNLSLTGLSADADVELLDSNRVSIPAIPASTNSGLLSESINATLNSGIYYIRVYPGSGTPSTDYKLNVQAQNTNTTDILWRNQVSGGNYVWFMNGTTQLGGTYINSVTDTNWKIGGTGDFNGDGKVDILWRNQVSGGNYVWFMNGTTQLGGTGINSVPDTNWKIGGTGLRPREVRVKPDRRHWRISAQ